MEIQIIWLLSSFSTLRSKWGDKYCEQLEDLFVLDGVVGLE